MSPELERRLKAAHPTLLRCLRDEESRSAIGDYGIQRGGGWFSIIDALCSALELTVGAATPTPYVSQVKEKFGKLCVHVDNVPSSARPDVDALIATAQERSAAACEVCGGPAVLRWQRGVQTVCDLHASPEARVVQEGDVERIQAEREARRKKRVA